MKRGTGILFLMIISGCDKPEEQLKDEYFTESNCAGITATGVMVNYKYGIMTPACIGKRSAA